MESPLVELTRVLYHLDYFRRNFRQLSWHHCNNNNVSSVPCVVCNFKNLFTDLSLLMRESVLDPPHIHRMIESKIEDINWRGIGRHKTLAGNSHANAVIYESVVRQLEDGTQKNKSPPGSPLGQNAPPGPGLELHTEFNVTKICLHCRTTSYVEAISQYVMQIDSSTLLSNDWPSFEFAIKTALDSEEFCIQPNCHGQTKVFRVLNALPAVLPISFTDPTPGSLITLLPSRLRPHLIFETSKTVTDLFLKAVILYSPQWGYATLFHHSRLDMWIFIDSRRVLSLNRTWIESRFHPITYGFTVHFCFYCKEEQIPDPQVMDPPILPMKQMSPRTRYSASTNPTTIEYKPPPCDMDSRIYENWPLDTDSGQGSEFSSNCSSSASGNSRSSSFYIKESTYSSYRGYAAEQSSSPTGADSMNGTSVNNNKFATVRRKMKYQRRGNRQGGGPGPSSLSLSVPDLSNLTSAASAIRRQPSNEFETSSRQSIDSSNRKVSFNCEVTLVNDFDDEYIPHPIFQSVLQKLQQNCKIDDS